MIISIIENKKINRKIFVAFILSFPFIDVLTSLITRFYAPPISIGIIIKGMFLAYLFIYVIYHLFKGSEKRLLILTFIYFLLFLFWLFCFLFNRIEYLTFSNIISEIILVFKYFSFIITLILMYLFVKYNKFGLTDFINVMNVTFICYIIIMLIPFITDTGFPSYRISPNIGTSGWFYSANEIGAILLLLLNHALSQLKKNNSLTNYLFIPMAIFLTLEIGTKVVLFGVIFILIFHFGINLLNFKNSKLKYFLIILPISFLLIINSAPIKNIQLNVTNEATKNPNSLENIDPDSGIPNYDIESTPIFDFCETNDLLAKITSGRNYFICSNYKIYGSSDLSIQLTGIGISDIELFGNKNINKLIEIDIFDILFRFGLIGFIIYFLPFGLIFYLIFKNIFKHRLFNLDILNYFFIILMQLGISLIAGHVLGAPSVSIYLAVTIICLWMTTNNPIDN